MMNGDAQIYWQEAILEQIAKQSARMTDNNDWDDPDEVKRLEKFKDEARRNGCSERAINRAIKVRSKKYEIVWCGISEY